MGEISLYDHEWRLEVTGQLAALIQQTADLTDQVRRQNGNVARLWEHMNAVEQHPGLCPLHQRIATVETAVAEQRAGDRAARAGAARASEHWERWVRPVAVALLAFVLGLAARNPGALLKVVTGE